ALDFRVTLQIVLAVFVALLQSFGFVRNFAVDNDTEAGRYSTHSTQSYHFFSRNRHEGTFPKSQCGASRMGFDVVVITARRLPNTVEVRFSACEAFWFE